MQFTGYLTTVEVAEMLHVSAAWLDLELEAFKAPSIMLCNERNWRCDGLQQFVDKQHLKLALRQKEETKLQQETI